MALENLRKGLVLEGKALAKASVEEAQKEAGKIISQAKNEAKEIIENAKERAQNASKLEYEERISAAQLKAKKLTTEAANKTLESSLKMAWEEFAKISQSKEYEKIMKKMITQAESEIGQGAVVLVNSRDSKIVKKYAKNVSPKAVDIAGGAIVFTKDMKISIDNSLESIFESNRDAIKSEIFAQMGKK
ncbi:MAG TPA: V-type ATP synthase subunit E [archaeon]|nr:V-type ATP synthase subunit E [archaeon]